VRFAEANAVAQTPPILFNLARTEQLTGRLVDAARHFREYLALPSHPKVTADLRKQASTFLGDIDSKLGHVAVDAPAGSTITIDGAAGTLGTLDVQPGSHTIVAVLGPETRSTTVSCAAGQTVPAKLSFESPSPPPPPPPIAVTAPQVTPIPSGPEEPTHTGFWTGRREAGVVVAGAGVASLVVGIALQAVRSSDASSAATILAGLSPGECSNPNAPGCQSLDSAYNAQTRNADLSTGFLIGGGIALATGAALLLWPSSDSSKVSVVPVMTPRTAGLELWGDF
jgi:hypothetical protein